ncbi:histo-blood group ABO system transferase-like [Diceros bicornis minor]|uniref:histo-blood group ABO system transferase-like n=1 Tax=Diceros bicornis minor TaxID=77932 RepID=UPI0026EA59D5|nr:histo-blood group ABO system transferase-like [Diceros bicornis minor]
MAQLVRTLSENPKCYLLHRVIFLLLIALALTFFGSCYLNPRSQKLESIQAGAGKIVRKIHHLQGVKLPRTVYPQPNVLRPSRKDVQVMTPWLAPIIWDKTFNINILNEQFRLQKATIGLTVFAINKYIIYLQLFLETAEMHFMVGYKVNYYIFTDRPAYVPHIRLQKGRKIVILKVWGYAHSQNTSLHRMEMISNFSEQRFHQEVDYLVCADVNMKFSDHMGVEILSSLFGTLHPAFYGLSRNHLPYERRPRSQAHIPEDEGDFYYIGALFGGSVPEVYRLTKACHEAMMVDQHNHIEAVRHEESYLNKYLLYHKPSKVLSPEYTWDKRIQENIGNQQQVGLPSNIKRIRFVTVK